MLLDGISEEDLRRLDERAGACAAEVKREGEHARYRGFVLVRKDEVSAELAHTIGSGPGIRTLNLAVNRSLLPVQKWGSEFAELH